ncbi:hypothetical protein [Rhizobium gallicum]|uniref:hypothetical protein n=1 Tax=Rhizobium gallicum TaxID=56730 RepID=UPI001EF99740|nr:hypothetical protein [Rhizobium gallicum]ULJ70635.1 hypothetical protein L2W42_11755 [Rhizobium gallicum]
MFGLFGKKTQGLTQDQIELRNYTIEGLKKYLKQEGLPADAVEAMDVAQLIRNYVVIVTLGIYDDFKNRKIGDPMPAFDRIAVIVAGVQCAHLQWRMAHAGANLDDPRLLDLKGTMMQNIVAGLNESDLHNPTDADLGIMSRATVMYQHISKEQNHILQNLNSVWDAVFCVPMQESKEMVVAWMDHIIEYQKNGKPAYRS